MKNHTELLLATPSICQSRDLLIHVLDRTDPEFIVFAEITKDIEINWEPLQKVDLGPLVASDLACLPPRISVAEIIVLWPFLAQCSAQAH